MFLKPRYVIHAYLDGHLVEQTPEQHKKLSYHFYGSAVRARNQLTIASPPGWWYIVAPLA